jgi:hypothetical protein
VTWNGCIEERQTFQNTDGTPTDDWSPIPATALDTDFNLVPSSSNPASLWGPQLRNATWLRYSGGNRTLNNTTTGTQASAPACPAEANLLQTWPTAGPFEGYVDGLFATGSTYHDIGLVWGARLISPTGIFAADNAATPSGQPIQRHIVFMTDGDTMTNVDNYSAYGVTWWNRLQTSYAPNSGHTDDIVDARLTALCTAIRNQNITLWVISYGGGVNSTTETRLRNCASSGKFFSASDTATLISNFRTIASEIADLRLTS